MHTPTTLFTVIILSLSIAATSAAPVTASTYSIDLLNTTIIPLNSTTLVHPGVLTTNTCRSALTQHQISPTLNVSNSITYNVPRTSPQMTLLFFAFGAPIPLREYQFAALEAVSFASSSIHRGDGLKPIAHGSWTHRTVFEDVASVLIAIFDHSQLGPEKAINYLELVSVLRGIGTFMIETSRYEECTFDVSIAGRDSVGAGHVERITERSIGDGSGCESTVPGEGSDVV